MYSFKRTEEQELLLESLGEMMQEFPDEYWKKCDEERNFPQSGMRRWWNVDFIFSAFLRRSAVRLSTQ